MPSTFSWIDAWPPKGGLNTAENPVIRSLDTLAQADNIIFTSDLRRTQMPGQTQFSVTNGTVATAQPQVKYVYDFWYRGASNSMTNRVIKVNAGYVNADTQGDGNFNNINGTTTLGAEDRVTLETLTNRMILCSETAVPQMYTGTGTLSDLGGSPPNGALCRKHMGRLWVAGVKASPHTLYYSQAFNVQLWSGTGTGSLEIDPDDNDPVGITAIFPSFWGELYVAKRNALYQVTGSTPSTFQVIPLVSGLGCLEHNSVARVNNDILFASDRGIHSLAASKKGSGLATEFASFDIQPSWEAQVEVTSARRFMGVWLRKLNSYVFLYPSTSSGYADSAYVFNATLGAWAAWPNFDVSSMAEVYYGNHTRILCGRNDGIVSTFSDTALDNLGGEIRPVIKVGPSFPAGKPSLDLGFKQLSVTYSTPQGASLLCSYKVDGFATRSKVVTPDTSGTPLGAGFILGQDLLGGGSGLTVSVFPMQGTGKTVSIQQSKVPPGTVLGPDFIMGVASLENASTRLDFYGFGVQVEGQTESLKAEATT